MPRMTGRVKAQEELPPTPIYVEEGTILRGLHIEVLDLSVGEGEGNEHVGGVTTGAGCGTDFVTLEWRGRKATFFLRDVLRAWVSSFDPEDAEKLPAVDVTLEARCVGCGDEIGLEDCNIPAGGEHNGPACSDCYDKVYGDRDVEI